MQTQAIRTRSIVDRASPPDSTLLTRPTVAQRSTRRATARRVSSRRAAARQHKGDLDGRVLGYVRGHPQSTIGEMAKGLNANRDTIAAEVSHMVRAGKLTRELGSRTLSAAE